MATKNKKVIHLKGLCGAGKSTIARMLSKKLNARVFRIGKYRKKGVSEIQVWLNLHNDILDNVKEYDITIVESSGVNGREGLLQDLPKNVKLIQIYLDAPLKVLSKRIDMKPIWERGTFNWLFRVHWPFKEYKTKYDFNRKLLKYFNKAKGEGIIVDATKSLDKVFNKVLSIVEGNSYY